MNPLPVRTQRTVALVTQGFAVLGALRALRRWRETPDWLARVDALLYAAAVVTGAIITWRSFQEDEDE
jgi:hypothetical protein